MIVPDKPDPAAAKVIQEILGGRFGEMRTISSWVRKAPYPSMQREIHGWGIMCIIMAI